jgi:hypothetical protein
VNLIYNVQLRRIEDNAGCGKTCLTKAENGQTAEQRAVAATIAAAGPGNWIVQGVTLTNIDIDLLV